MFFGAFIVDFEIWLLVCRPKLSLLHILTIVTCLHMNFYTGALFNPFWLLHRCCLHPHTFPLHMLHNVPSLDLMAVAPLLIGAEEEEEPREVTPITITISILAILTVGTMRAPLGRTPGVTAATSSSRNKEGNTSGLDRLDANFAATLNILHFNALSLCIMRIKPRPTSPLVMLQ